MHTVLPHIDSELGQRALLAQDDYLRVVVWTVFHLWVVCSGQDVGVLFEP